MVVIDLRFVGNLKVNLFPKIPFTFEINSRCNLVCATTMMSYWSDIHYLKFLPNTDIVEIIPTACGISLY